MNQKTSSISKYCLQDQSQLHQAIFEFVDIAIGFGSSKKSEFDIWQGAIAINNLLDDLSSDDADADFKFYQFGIINLINSNLFTTISREIGSLNELFDTIPKENYNDTIADVFKKFDLNEATLLGWSKAWQGLKSEKKLEVTDKIDNLVKVYDELKSQLEVVCEILKLIEQPQSFYSADEALLILSGKEQKFSNVRLCKSLRFFYNDNDFHEDARILLNALLLDKNFKKSEYTWDEIVWLYLVLALVWKEFPRLSALQQSFVLTNYFFRSIMLNLPVQKAIGDTLYFTRNIVSYMELNALLVQAIKANLEVVTIDNSTQVLGNMACRFSEEKISKNGIVGFVNKFWPESKDYEINKNKQWIVNFFEMYLKLINGKFIENNMGGEMTEVEIANNELVRLITMFGIGESGFGEIIEYYKKQNFLVPIKSFFSELREIVELDENVVGDLLALTSLLKENGILLPEQEVVEYLESDNKFYWANWIS